jgi:hypothetical protein
MNILGSALDVIGNVGFGVIRHSGGIVWGGSKAIVGVIAEDEEMIGAELGSVAKSAVGLGLTLVGKALSEDNLGNEPVSEDIDLGL